MDVTGKKVLIVVTHGPEAPERCSSPFFFAIKAAGLGAQVSMCFILQGALLLKQGVAEDLYAQEGGRSVHSFLKLALKAGVELYACDAAMKTNGMSSADLIEEVENLVGPNFLITHGLEADLVLNF